MSVARAMDGDGGDPAYHETEVQHVKFVIEHGSGEQNTQIQVSFSDEVLGPDGMDRDLLAELVAANYRHEAHLEDQNNATNTTPGAAQSRAVFGINVDRDDSVLFVEGTQGVDSNQVLEGDPDDLAIESEVSDSPGNLWESKLTVSPAFNDTVNGTGGGADYDHVEQLIDYRQLFETGPVVDATDDIQAVLRNQHDAVGGQSVTFLYATLYWKLHEIEGARPQFGL